MMKRRTFKTIRPYVDPDTFGTCYECKDEFHDRCIGVPCDCACPPVMVTTQCDSRTDVYGRCELLNNHRGAHRNSLHEHFWMVADIEKNKARLA